ncbi:MAG: TlpA family protein disulfide reductase [Akkermansiaceae bacterium]
MDKKSRKKGLVIIGAESQGSSDAQIKKITDNAKVEFTITKGVNGPAKVRGIPYALVFDTSGSVIFKGSPSSDDFEKTIKKALKEVGDEEEPEEKRVRKTNAPLIPQRNWTNEEGKKISASVTSVTGDTVIFKLHNLKVVKYQLSKLSEADQKMINTATEEAAKATENAE